MLLHLCSEKIGSYFYRQWPEILPHVLNIRRLFGLNRTARLPAILPHGFQRFCAPVELFNEHRLNLNRLH